MRRVRRAALAALAGAAASAAIVPPFAGIPIPLLAAPRAAADSALSGATGDVHPTPAARVLRPRAGPGPSFAIVAVDSAASAWGVACAAPSIACGARIPAAAAGAGAVAVLGAPTGDVALAALAALARGAGAAAAIDSARSLPGDPESWQIAAIGAGGAAAVSGKRLRGWAGAKSGKAYACVGQGLDGGEPLQAMAAAFEAASGDLSSRLLAALVAAAMAVDPDGAFEEAGGEASAALLVVRAGASSAAQGSDRLVDLRVDAADDPIPPLERLHDRLEGSFLAAAHVRLGDRAKRLGDETGAAREYRAAEAGFRGALARAPKDSDALNELSWFLATHGGDPAEALRLAEAAVAARGDDANLYDTLAEAAYRSGNLERAIDAEQRAERLSRGNARYAERLRTFRAAKAALTKEAGPASPDSVAGAAPSR
ncbi:MAG TPA: DUF1028 domain-containing protein [Candidatus Eisenbacteria bacterium]